MSDNPPAPALQPVASSAAAPASVVATGVKVNLRPVGTAPALQKAKFRVGAAEPFATVIAFLRKQLGLGTGDSLFCYLHASFAPTPAQLVGDLAAGFASDGELVVHYSLQPAYG